MRKGIIISLLGVATLGAMTAPKWVVVQHFPSSPVAIETPVAQDVDKGTPNIQQKIHKAASPRIKQRSLSSAAIVTITTRQAAPVSKHHLFRISVR